MYDQEFEKRVHLEWLKMVSSQKTNQLFVSDFIAASWKRCLEKKLNPINFKAQKLIQSDISILLKNNYDFIKIAVPIMKEIYAFIEGSGSFVVLTDRNGIIISSIGDEEFHPITNIAEPGTSWSEEVFGTNGAGTAIKLNKPLQIRGSEHFFEPIQVFTCSACPIHNSDGKIIGCLDISSSKENVNYHTLGMTIAAAKSIEKQVIIKETLKEKDFHLNKQKAILEVISAGILVLDNELRVTNINNRLMKILKLSENPIGKHIREFIRTGINFNTILAEGTKTLDKETDLKLDSFTFYGSISMTPILNNDNVEGIVLTIKERARVYKEINRVTGSNAYITFDKIMGKSQRLKKCIELAKIASNSFSNVLLLGASGTGKELFAQSIHTASDRKANPFIAVNCGAIPRDLVQTELFGYEGGAFTGSKREGHPGKFELADGGTIFLDEIGDMPLDAQVNLLRVLETREVLRVGSKKAKPVNVRVIAATHADLNKKISENRFREDLFYRLNVFTIYIPSLSERKEDIPELVNYFLKKNAEKFHKNVHSISYKAMDILLHHHWNGNVRELENVIERAVNVVTKDEIKVQDLPYDYIKNYNSRNNTFSSSERITLQDSEYEHITRILKETNGNIKKTAEMLGVVRSTVYDKLKKYSIDIQEFR